MQSYDYYNPNDPNTWARPTIVQQRSSRSAAPEVIEVGSVVRLKSGGPALSVYKVSEEDVGNGNQQYAYVIVWADDQVKEYKLPFSVLICVG